MKFDGTPKTKRLCKQICKSSNGEVILLFSGGKDSTAAWQFLIDCGFTKIHPVFCDFIPGLKITDRLVKYYSKLFKTKIHRFLLPEGIPQIGNLIFQDVADKESIIDLDLWMYHVRDVAYFFQQENNISDKVWTAHSLLESDSLVRRIAIRKAGPKKPDEKVFFPIFDWKPLELLDYLRERNIKLSEEYRYSNRTLCGVPEPDCLERIKQQRPEDYDLIVKWFPLVEAKIARNRFRKKHFNQSTEVNLVPT